VLEDRGLQRDPRSCKENKSYLGTWDKTPPNELVKDHLANLEVLDVLWVYK
jgi:hypothetical protein